MTDPVLVLRSVREGSQRDSIVCTMSESNAAILQGPGAAPEAKPPAAKPEDAKPEDAESKFKAFTGRPRSLRD